MPRKKKQSQVEIYRMIRKRWAINPKTRVKKNDKIYNRGKSKRETRKTIEEEI